MGDINYNLVGMILVSIHLSPSRLQNKNHPIRSFKGATGEGTWSCFDSLNMFEG